MADGALRIFKVMNKVAETNKQTAQFVNVSVKSLDPLVFNLDDKVDLTDDFYQLDKTFVFDNLQLGVVCQAIVLNNGQLYFILSNGENEIGNFWFTIDSKGHLILEWAGAIHPDFNINELGHLLMTYIGEIAPNIYIDANGHCIYNY